jgi:hypothetical protein
MSSGTIWGREAISRKGTKPSKGKPPRPQRGGAASSQGRRFARWGRVAWLCVLLVPVLVPFATLATTLFGLPVRPPTYDQFDLVKLSVLQVLVLIGLGAWGWSVVFEGARVYIPKGGLLIAALLAWGAVTTLTSVRPATALFGSYLRYDGQLTLVTYALLFFLAVQVLHEQGRLGRLAEALVIGGFVVSLFGVLQLLGWLSSAQAIDMFGPHRAYATFGNPNMLGGYLVFPLALAPALALTEGRTGRRVFWWVAFSSVPRLG